MSCLRKQRWTKRSQAAKESRTVYLFMSMLTYVRRKAFSSSKAMSRHVSIERIIGPSASLEPVD